MLQKHCISCWEIKMSLSRSLSSGWGAYKWAQNNDWYVTQYSGVLGKKKKKKRSEEGSSVQSETPGDETAVKILI